MAELQLARFIAYLIHRKIHYPAELIALLIHMPGYGCAEHLAHDAGCLLRGSLCSRGNAYKAAGGKLERLGYGLMVRRNELGYAAGKAAVRLYLEPIRLLTGLHLNIGAKLVNMLPCKLTAAACYGLYGVSLCKRGKLAAFNYVSYILYPEIYAVIRLVAAELLQSVIVRYALERRGGGNVVCAVFCEYRRQHVLYYGEHVLLRGKRHLHIELIELARAPVPPRVLITEAGGYLEIPVKAGGHKELLELLRRLRKGVELARVLPRGHEIIPCALWA